MPLENNMENPRHFAKPAGVLNTGMTAVTVIYLIVGVLGYVAYGDNVQGSISSNLEISYMYVFLFIRDILIYYVSCTSVPS